MKKSIMIALAIILASAVSGAAQVSVGASYLAGIYPAQPFGISIDLALGVDFNSRYVHAGVEVLFWQGYLGAESSFDFVFLRSANAGGPFGYSFGAGPELWLSYLQGFPGSNVLLFVQLHLPFEITWSPAPSVPVEVFAKLSAYAGIETFPNIGSIYHGLDVYLGARYVLTGSARR